MLQEAELSGQADSENDLGGSSVTMYLLMAAGQAIASANNKAGVFQIAFICIFLLGNY